MLRPLKFYGDYDQNDLFLLGNAKGLTFKARD